MVKYEVILEFSSAISSTTICMADDTTIKATSIGPIKCPIPLASVPGLLVPGLAENLLSISQLADQRVVSVFNKDKVEFYKSPLKIVVAKIGEGQHINCKYLVRPLTAFPASTSPASLLTWHFRLSHLAEASIRRLSMQGVISLTDWDRSGIETCMACKKGRLTRRKFSSQEKYKASCPLEIVHSNVCQLSHPSHECFRYFVSFIDDYSRFAVVYKFNSTHKFSIALFTSLHKLSVRWV